MFKTLPLTPEQWQRVVDNLPLIGWTINRINHPSDQAKADAEDAGLDGLMMAVRSHKEGRAKFGYYAAYCIRMRIRAARHREAEKREREDRLKREWAARLYGGVYARRY